MRTIIITLLFICIGCKIFAQDSLTFGLEYVSELQSDFRKVNNCTLLKLNADIPICNRLSALLSTVSILRTNKNFDAGDLLGFSNIDADNTPITPIVAGLSFQATENQRIYLGLRNIDEDYFDNDALGVFANSSCGAIPTIAANYPVATYPTVAICLHYDYAGDRFGIKTSVYNGISRQCFSAENKIFRINFKEDGIFAIAQADYQQNESHYYCGVGMHHEHFKGIACKTNYTVFAYGEQRIHDYISILASYSHVFCNDIDCKDFAGVGVNVRLQNITLGMFGNRADFADATEYATEITMRIKCGMIISLQPTMQVISNVGLIGSLRLMVEV